MFKQRLLTTLILVPFVLLAIYYINYFLFSLVLLVIMAACGFEWLQLIPLNGSTSKHYLLQASFFIALFAISYFAAGNYWLLGELLLWLFILILVTQYPKLYKLWAYPAVVAFFGLYLLPFFIHSFSQLYLMERGKQLIVYTLFLVWAADIGAYLAGKQYGKHKLIPKVSPGKTIEGVTGGMSLSLVVTLIGFFIFKPNLPLNWFVLSIATVLISLLGDLFISMLKRRVGLKDTGNILPGHGGVLDRLDSLIAAVPVFYAGLLFFSPGL